MLARFFLILEWYDDDIFEAISNVVILNPYFMLGKSRRGLSGSKASPQR